MVECSIAWMTCVHVARCRSNVVIRDVLKLKSSDEVGCLSSNGTASFAWREPFLNDVENGESVGWVQD